MKKLFKKYRLFIFSFFLSFFLMLAIYAVSRIYPFGNKTLLTMDMSGQYVNYLAYFRNILLGKASLFYNFSMNLGSNCYGLFAYYLSSPLNILLCLFKESHITEAILLLNLIKIALCSMTMSIFLSKTTKLKNRSVLLFSMMYALMSYNIVYSQNIMWLDGCIYLPLVILGIENILSKKRYWLYVISLFFCIFSNFYVGYMVGLFSVIYAIIRFFQIYKLGAFREYRDVIKTYVKATVITLLLATIILLPVFLNLLASKSDIDSSGFLFELYYSPLDLFSKFAIGAFDQGQLAFGPPNLYCGVLCLVLSLLYFVTATIDKKERLLDFFFVTLLLLCFLIIPFNLFFHMLQTPVWFPFRNSFLFSFLLIVIAAKFMDHHSKPSLESILKVDAILIFFLMILHKFSYSYLSVKSVLLTILFLLAISISYYFSEQKTKKYSWLLVTLVALEMFFNGYRIVKQLDYVERDQFVSSYTEAHELISKYQADATSFFRIENKIARSINDPMLHNYNGFYHYSSLSGKANKDFLTKFGLRHNLIMENASDTTLPMSSLLGVRYYMSNSSKDKNTSLYHFLEKNVYENPYALSLGFMVTDQVKNIKLGSQPLENVNRLFQGMTSSQQVIFEEISLKDNESIIKDPNEEWYLVYSIKTSDRKALSLSLDGARYKSTSEVTDQDHNVVYIPKGVENIEIECSESYKLKAYRYHPDVFESLYQKLRRNQFKVLENKQRRMKGVIDVKEDGVFLTSIIDDDGWIVKVDGKKVEKLVVADHLLALDLSKGEHTIEFSYLPSGFYLGVLSFGVGTTFLVVDYFCIKKKRRKK